MCAWHAFLHGCLVSSCLREDDFFSSFEYPKGWRRTASKRILARTVFFAYPTSSEDVPREIDNLF
jgi:hypothetical protein